MEQRLKLIRNESIGNVAWDSNNTNDWANATLNTNLNSGDYWTNSLSEGVKSMIDNAVWYLGGTSNYQDSNNGLASHFYSNERGTIVYSGRSTSWTGKVGLIYPSDYGYATSGGTTIDRNACLNAMLYNWDSDCYNNNWLFKKTDQYVITSPSELNFSSFIISSSGTIYEVYSTSGDYDIYPIVYLKSSIKIVDGDGSSSNPYILQG